LGRNEESDERCGIDTGDNKGELIGHVHVCCRLKCIEQQVKGSMATKVEPIATGDTSGGRSMVRALRTAGTALREEEMSRFADVQSGAVADRENMRQAMLGKVAEEEKYHDGNMRDIKKKHEREIEYEDGKHKEKLREIQGDYDKETNAFAGILKMRESKLKHEFEEKNGRSSMSRSRLRDYGMMQRMSTRTKGTSGIFKCATPIREWTGSRDQ